MMQPTRQNNEIVISQSEDGRTLFNARSEGENVWIVQAPYERTLSNR